MTIVYQIVCLIAGLVVFGIVALLLYEIFSIRFKREPYLICTDDQLHHVTLPPNFLLKIFHLLKISHEILSAVGVRYVACGGTLLSMIRSGYLTPWDDDGDLYVFKTDFDEKRDEIDKLLLKHKVCLNKTFALFDVVNLQFCDDNPLMQEFPSDGSPCVDWFMIDKMSDGRYDFTSSVVRSIFPYDFMHESELFPFKTMTLRPNKTSEKSITLNVANKSVAILNRSYGTKENPELWKSCYLASSHRDPTLLFKPCQMSQKHIDDFNYSSK